METVGGEARGAAGAGAKAGQGGRFGGYRATRICIRKNSCAEVLICTPSGNLGCCCCQSDEVTGARLGLRLGLPLPLEPGQRLGVGVGPAQQFVDVRTDKLTGSRATRWQVPVTLAWQEAAAASAAAATSALTRCPTWRCSALQQLVLAAQLDLAWLGSAQLGMIKPPKVWIISFCNVLLPRSLPCLCRCLRSCLCPSHTPYPCPFALLQPPLASAVPPASVASCCCCCFAGNE